MPRPRHTRISASARPDIGDRRTGSTDRREGPDENRRQFPPRPEGRRATGGRRKDDPREP
jgi:hypothetical protein